MISFWLWPACLHAHSYGLGSQYGDLYAFVRTHAALLDAATVPHPDPRSHVSESSYNLTYNVSAWPNLPCLLAAAT